MKLRFCRSRSARIAGVVGRPFDAAVPRQVVVVAVAVVLAVGLVVLLVVGNQVLQREAVVRGDEVDAGMRPPARPSVQVLRAGEALRQVAHHAIVALPVAAHAVAEAVVPLGPAVGEVADAVAAVAEVPGLRDQLHAVERRVLADRVEEAAEVFHLARFARQRGGEVEAEAVDVHLLDPVAQRVHHQLQRARMLQVHGVAAAGEVVVEAPALRVGDVVGGVVDAAHGQRRPEMVAFAAVVVDHVEDDLDARRVQRLHHGLELLDLERRAVAHLRREVGEGVVAPVVLHPLVRQVAIVQEGVHRQQLDGGHAQALQVVDHRRRAERCIGAAQMRRHFGMGHGEAAHVHLVDHHVLPRDPRAAVVPQVNAGSSTRPLGISGALSRRSKERSSRLLPTV